MKIALFILCDTDRLENLGRMSNAFMMAKEALENDDDLKFIFSGASKVFGEMVSHLGFFTCNFFATAPI
mgnify:CR=1 FL=1